MTKDRHNPWETLSSRDVFENNWIKLTDHKVITPGGTDGTYGAIHFKNRAVGVVPYEKGYIWLVGQTRYVLDQYSWEIPEGGCPKNEDLEDCALRELQEETGLIATNLKPIVQMHLSNSVSDEWAIVYLATGLTQSQAAPEPTEDISVAKVTLEEFYQRVETGEITDSLSVAACYKLMLMKANGEL